MRIGEIAAVVRSEWSSYVQSQLLLRLTGSHLGVTLVVLISTWPDRMQPARPEQALTWNWFVYLQFGILTYVALAMAADLLPVKGRIAPYEWVYYGVARPVNVLIGRFIAVGALLALMLFLVAPLGLAAYSLRAVGFESVVGCLLVAATGCLCLMAAGAFFSTGSTERALRLLSAIGLYAGVFALLVALSGWIGPWDGRPRAVPLNPLVAMDYFLTSESPPDSAPRFESTRRPFPWGAWAAVYTLLFLLFAGPAYVRLWEWQPNAQARPGRHRRTEGRSPPPQKD